MSFADLFKPINDLFKFDTKKKVTFKTQTAEGVSLKAATTLGANGGMNVESKFKRDGVDVKKLAANTDGHFDAELDIDVPVDGVTFQTKFTVGSDAWQSNDNSESASLGVNFSGVKNLDFNVACDIIGSPQATLSTDFLYTYNNFAFGGDFGFNLPFAVDGGSVDFGRGDSSLAVKYTQGAFSLGTTLANPGASNDLSLNFLHQASSDFQWGARVTGLRDLNVAAELAAQTQLDNSTTLSLRLAQSGTLDLKYKQVVSSALTVTYGASLELSDDKLGGDGKFGVGVEISA